MLQNINDENENEDDDNGYNNKWVFVNDDDEKDI